MIKEFFTKVWEKIKTFSRWVKRKVKQIAITLGIIGIATAATLPAILPDHSFESLPNVAKEQGLYRVNFDKWSEVEIKDQDRPEVVLKKWGDETYIKISYPDFTPVNPKQNKGKLKWQNGNKEVHLYPLEPRDFEENGHQVKQLEQGGFEFEVILKEKPATNKIVLNIETKGLKFYYQPELTQKEKDEGYFRPENVVGSYAVYHETQDKKMKTEAEGEKYKAGIFGMFYRPKATDANGDWVWCDLFIDEKSGVSTITVPQDFLDKAAYPVSTGTENFGYEVGGSSYVSSNKFWSYACGDTYTGGVGTGVSMFIYAYKTSGTVYAQMGLYDTSSPTAHIGHTDAVELPASVDWVSANFTSAPDLDAVGYYLSFQMSASTVGQMALNVVATNGYKYHADDYGVWSATRTWSMSSTKNEYSIYCTYTPSAEEEETWGWTTMPD